MSEDRCAVAFVEVPSGVRVVAPDDQVAGVDLGVVVPAQEHAVRYRCLAAVGGPVLDVVDLAELRGSPAGRVGAVAVACDDGAAHRAAVEPFGAPDVEYLGVRPEDDARDLGIAGQAGEDGGGDRRPVRQESCIPARRNDRVGGGTTGAMVRPGSVSERVDLGDEALEAHLDGQVRPEPAGALGGQAVVQNEARHVAQGGSHALGMAAGVVSGWHADDGGQGGIERCAVDGRHERVERDAVVAGRHRAGHALGGGAMALLVGRRIDLRSPPLHLLGELIDAEFARLVQEVPGVECGVGRGQGLAPGGRGRAQAGEHVGVLERDVSVREAPREAGDGVLGDGAGEAGLPFGPGPCPAGLPGEVLLEVASVPARGRGGPPPVRLDPGQESGGDEPECILSVA